MKNGSAGMAEFDVSLDGGGVGRIFESCDRSFFGIPGTFWLEAVS